MNQQQQPMSPAKKKFYKVIYWLLLLIRAIVFPFSKLLFILIIILFGFYAFIWNAQGQDLMAVFTGKSILRDNYFLLFGIFLVCWAVAIWMVSRILLTAANLKKDIAAVVDEKDLVDAKIAETVHRHNWVVGVVDTGYERAMEFMTEWTPRVLALCPYLMFVLAYEKQFEDWMDGNVAVIVLVALLHFSILTFRQPLWEMIVRRKHATPRQYSIDKHGFFESIRVSRMVINTILTTAVAITMMIYAYVTAMDTPSANGKPGLILLAGFTIYTLVGMLISQIVNRYKVPVFGIGIIVALFFFAKCNNNHSVQVLTSPADTMMLYNRNKMTDSQYARYWIHKKLADKTLDKSMPQTVFIVAAEGGGIRNCYWTYRILTALQQKHHDFYDRTFAVTGVSGGSIGLGFYYNYKYFIDSINNNGKDSLQLAMALNTICRSDYLSRVTFGLIFPDLVQRFLPFPIESWDRSKMLANSFDDGFSAQLGKRSDHLLSSNYLTMWDDTATAYRRPIVLFNTIFNEAGLKAVYAPYRLSDTYYTGVMDILNEVDRPVPMKEAMVSSARFPILSAPGLLWHYTVKDGNSQRKKLGHISDGGGYENTAIHTAIQTALLLQKSLESDSLPNVRIKVIYIGTGTTALEMKDRIPSERMLLHSKPAELSYEIAWLNGAVQTVFGWIKGSHNLTTRLNSKLSVLQFGLDTHVDKGAHKLPLGWYLSDTSQHIMDLQVRDSLLNPNVGKSFKVFDSLARRE